MPTDLEYRAEFDRKRYELIKRNQAALGHINELAAREALEVMVLATDLERQVYGGYARETLPPLLDKWGNVSAAAALDHYNAVALEYARMNAGSRDNRPAYKRAQNVIAGKLYVAKLPEFDLEAMAEEVISRTMWTYANSGPGAANSMAANALTRQVGAYHRDTMVFNAGLDSNVKAVQRVAEPNACAFCRTVAIGYGRYGTRSSSYAVHWHDHCKCSIEVLYEDDTTLEPDYYGEFQKNLDDARSGNYDDSSMRELRSDATTSEGLRDLVQRVRAASGAK